MCAFDGIEVHKMYLCIVNTRLSIMFEPFILHLKHKLSFPLPGEEAQYKMAHVNRELFPINVSYQSSYRPSAVLILIYPDSYNAPHILLIERVKYDGHHSGQIALPGGKFEPEDLSLQQTALREFFEETGSSHTPELIGKLSPVYIPVSLFMVQPYVSFLEQKPQFNINATEVEQLIEWPVKHLLNDAFIKQTQITTPQGYKLQTPYFDVDGKILWGATAMIMSELKHILE